jgi:hypothetical protein
MVFCGRWKNRTDRNRKPHEPQPQIARTATANCTHRNRKLHEPQPQTARTATANRTNSDRTNRNRKPHEPQRNRSVNLFLGSTVQDKEKQDPMRICTIILNLEQKDLRIVRYSLVHAINCYNSTLARP